MKKFIIAALFSFLIIPSFSFASTINPLTFFELLQKSLNEYYANQQGAVSTAIPIPSSSMTAALIARAITAPEDSNGDTQYAQAVFTFILTPNYIYNPLNEDLRLTTDDIHAKYIIRAGTRDETNVVGPATITSVTVVPDTALRVGTSTTVTITMRVNAANIPLGIHGVFFNLDSIKITNGYIFSNFATNSNASEVINVKKSATASGNVTISPPLSQIPSSTHSINSIDGNQLVDFTAFKVKSENASSVISSISVRVNSNQTYPTTVYLTNKNSLGAPTALYASRVIDSSHTAIFDNLSIPLERSITQEFAIKGDLPSNTIASTSARIDITGITLSQGNLVAGGLPIIGNNQYFTSPGNINYPQFTGTIMGAPTIRTTTDQNGITTNATATFTLNINADASLSSVNNGSKIEAPKVNVTFFPTSSSTTFTADSLSVTTIPNVGFAAGSVYQIVITAGLNAKTRGLPSGLYQAKLNSIQFKDGFTLNNISGSITPAPVNITSSSTTNRKATVTNGDINASQRTGVLYGTGLKAISEIYLIPVGGTQKYNLTWSSETLNGTSLSVSYNGTSTISAGRYSLYIVNSAGVSLPFSINLPRISPVLPGLTASHTYQGEYYTHNNRYDFENLTISNPIGADINTLNWRLTFTCVGSIELSFLGDVSSNYCNFGRSYDIKGGLYGNQSITIPLAALRKNANNASVKIHIQAFNGGIRDTNLINEVDYQIALAAG